MKRVALDGWDWLFAPTSPTALHLLAVAEHPPAGVELLALLPGPRPDWLPVHLDSVSDLPTSRASKPVHLDSVSDLPTSRAWGRLSWEQRRIPALARQVGASRLHSQNQSPPFFPGLPCTLSADRINPDRAGESAGGLGERLRRALAAGGAARLAGSAQLWPADLTPPPALLQPILCKPWAPQVFRPADGTTSQTDIAVSGAQYALYHGPDSPAALQRLAAAWSWAARSVGSHIPLVAAGLSPAGQALLRQIAGDQQLTETIQIIPAATPTELAELYAGCLAVFHPAELQPWGDPITLALAAGCAIAAADTPAIQQRVGPAAYLADPHDTRALGAALLTILVEERIAADLGQSAQARYAALPGLPVENALAALWS